MSKELSHIEYYFPKGEFADKEAIASAIADLVEDGESLDYCGHPDKASLKKSLVRCIGHGSIGRCRPITEEERGRITRIVEETIEECDDTLSVPYKNYVFIYPFLPGDDAKMFNGVMGLATYSCVFHLFIDLDNFSEQSLIDSVAHELNHTIYYAHHYGDFTQYSLLDNIVMEGLAENFKEDLFTSESTPWASALEKDEAFQILDESTDILTSTDREVISEFIYGDKKSRKRWTGYSVGYWLVRKFLKGNPNLSWDEVMHLDAEDFLRVV